MKIHQERFTYYTKERMVGIIRKHAEYIIDPTAKFNSDKVGRSKESVTVDGISCMVFKPEDLNDEELLYLSSRLYGGFVTNSIPEVLRNEPGLEKDYSSTRIREIEVKE